jgi:hypothetical protein
MGRLRRSGRLTAWAVAAVVFAGIVVVGGPMAGAAQAIRNRAWAGYIVEDLATGNITGASGAWTAPTATCGTKETSTSVVWAGIGGDTTSAIRKLSGKTANEPIFQIGTAADCTKGKPTYYAWYGHHNPGHMVKMTTIKGVPVSPGDAISGSVVEDPSTKKVAWTISDRTAGWVKSTHLTNTENGDHTGECVVENPSRAVTVADFGQVDFSACAIHRDTSSWSPLAKPLPRGWEPVLSTMALDNRPEAKPSTTSLTVSYEGKAPPSANRTVSVPIVACPTTLGITEPAKSLPATKSLIIPKVLVGNVALYGDTQGKMLLLGPSGWECSATYGADGSGGVVAFPQGAPDPTTVPTGSAEAIVGSETSACVSCTLQQACPLFSAARARFAQLYSGISGCDAGPPAGEAVEELSTSAVNFSQPAAGSSGNRYPVSGAMTFSTPSSDGTSWVETCALPEGETALCTASRHFFVTEAPAATPAVPAPTTTTTTTTTAAPPSPSQQAEPAASDCTATSIQAAAQVFLGQQGTTVTVSTYGCTGNFAYAWATVANPGQSVGDTVTLLLGASGTGWAVLNRETYCPQGLVPSGISVQACTSN